MIKVKNMFSSSGKAIPNQFVINADGDRIFQSYNSVIAIMKHDGTVVLDREKWDYSVTTGRYRNQFLGEGIEETRRKIKEGIYRLENLN